MALQMRVGRKRLAAPSHARAATLAMRAAGTYDQSNQPSLLDQYEYAMYGKIYKWKQEKPKEAVCAPALRAGFGAVRRAERARRRRDREVYVSFGGLLMRLRGDSRHLRRPSSDGARALAPPAASPGCPSPVRG